MILTSLPDLPPRPETAANAGFRRNFYARWGRENAVVCGHATRAEYAVHPQTLSIKTTRGGRERYYLQHREVVVDDDNWLVLNDGGRYGSLLEGLRPAWSFCVFFRPGMPAEVAAEHRLALASVLDSPQATSKPIAFSEHLRPHGGAVSARLNHLATRIRAGERDQNWLEEQLLLLLDALLDAETRPQPAQASRRSQRQELQRRLRLAADHMQSHYTEALTIDRLAEIACLSRYHFVRAFAREYGLTPHAYLTRKRARAARRWLDAGISDRDWIAQRCGLGSRWTLARALR